MAKVIIIGAGIAGLSAGCYLQMNGYETEIFEMHNIAGGLCTSWERKGYSIDGCVHWFVGGNPIDPFYPIWNGLVDMKNFPRVTYEEFCRVEENGKSVRFIGNLDEWEQELKTVSPEDSLVIEEMIAGAKTVGSIYLPLDKAPEVMNIWDRLQMARKMGPMAKTFKKWQMPIKEYAQKFKSPLIRKLLTVFWWCDYSFAPMFNFLSLAACFHNKNGSYPLGGAEELVRRITTRYESLGGKINYNSKVDKIVVKENTAKAIQLKNGQILPANLIVSASDGRDTIFNMLQEKYVNENILKLYYDEKYKPKMSHCYVSLGVARKFNESFKPYVYITLKNPLKMGDKIVTDVGVVIHNFDPQASPEGKTVLTMMIPTYNIDEWVKLRNEDRATYDKKKEVIAHHLIEELDLYFGNIKSRLEMVDVATPASFIRYTNNWNGVPMSWQDVNMFIDKPSKEIEGLKNFLMCGHWVGDQGLSGAAQSGRDIAQILCKRDGKKFTALTYD